MGGTTSTQNTQVWRQFLDNVINEMPNLSQCCTKGSCSASSTPASSSTTSPTRTRACKAISQSDPTASAASAPAEPNCAFDTKVSQITQVNRISGKLPHCANIIVGGGEMTCPAFGCCSFDGFSSVVAKEFMAMFSTTTKKQRNAFLKWYLGSDVSTTVTYESVKKAVQTAITAQCAVSKTSHTQTIANSALTFGTSSNVNCTNLNVALNKMGVSIQCALGTVADAKKAAVPASVGPEGVTQGGLSVAIIAAIITASCVFLILMSFLAFRGIRVARQKRMMHERRVLSVGLTDNVNDAKTFSIGSAAVDALLQKSKQGENT